MITFNPTLTDRSKSAASATAKVMSELHPSSFVANRDVFLEKLLPVKKKDLNKIFNILTRNQTYDRGSSEWRPFTVPLKIEKDFYGPMVKTANAIQDAVTTLGLASAPIVWYDRSDKAPIAIGEQEEKTLLRPDIVAVFKRVRFWSCLSHVPRC